MRQTVRSAGLLSLFLLNLTTLPAEPLVRGFFIEKLPEKTAGKELAPGKGLVLAHVFNSGQQCHQLWQLPGWCRDQKRRQKENLCFEPERNHHRWWSQDLPHGSAGQQGLTRPAASSGSSARSMAIWSGLTDILFFRVC